MLNSCQNGFTVINNADCRKKGGDYKQDNVCVNRHETHIDQCG